MKLASTPQEDSEHGVDDDLDELFCTQCYHPLNHHLYDIRNHPVLSVPLCIVCYEATRKKGRGKRSEDTCTWCGREDAGLLYLCANEDTCDHQFCEDCIQNNLGPETLDEIKANDYWQCFVCRPNQLDHLRSLGNKARERSLYVKLLEGRKYESLDEAELATYCHILLENVVTSLNEEVVTWEKHYRDCELEVGGEVSGQKKKAELETLKMQWSHHFDILSTQDGLLSDLLSEMGYDAAVIDLHKSFINAQEVGKQYDEERFARLAATSELLERSQEDEKAKSLKRLKDAEKRAALENRSDDGDDTSSDQESSENSDNPAVVAKREQTERIALSDEIVQKYAQEEVVDWSRFPPQFLRKVPQSVLHALYYVCSDEERERLIERFEVPRHIAVILAYGDEPFPKSTNEWSLKNFLHPMVLQALFYAKSPPEVAVLGSYYNLPPNLTEMIDFDDDDQLKTNLPEATTSAKRRPTAKLYSQAYAEESHSDMMYLHRVRKETIRRLRTTPRRHHKRLIQRLDVLIARGEAHTNGAFTRERKEAQTQLSHSTTYDNEVEDSDYSDNEAGDDGDDDEHGALVAAFPDVCAKVERIQQYVVRQRQRQAQREQRRQRQQQRKSLSSLEKRGDRRSDSSLLQSSVDASDITIKPEYADKSTGVKATSASTFSASGKGNDDADHGGWFMDLAEDDYFSTVEDVSERLTHLKGSKNAGERSDRPGQSADPRNSDDSSNSSNSDDSHSEFDAVESSGASDNDERRRSRRGRHQASSTNKLNKRQGDERRSSSDAPEDAMDIDSEIEEEVKGSNTQSTSKKAGKSATNTSTEKSSSATGKKNGTKIKDEEEDDCIDLTLDDSADEDYVFEVEEDSSDDDDENEKSPVASKTRASMEEKPRAHFSIFRNVKPSTGESSARKKDSDPLSSSAAKRLDFLKEMNSLSSETKEAQRIEQRRRHEMLAYKHFPSEGGMVINEKRPADDPPIRMFDYFVPLLKAHQVDGVKFLWENVMKSVTDAKQSNTKETYGCILAHCMGLGKTFTVISFLVTLMMNPTIREILDTTDYSNAGTGATATATATDTASSATSETTSASASSSTPAAKTSASGTVTSYFSEVKSAPATDGSVVVSSSQPPNKRLLHRILVLSPVNTLRNWEKEFHHWTPSELMPLLNVKVLAAGAQQSKHTILRTLQQWYRDGGVLIIGYEMFRNCVDEDKVSKTNPLRDLEDRRRYLLDPGPDLVVADEAHVIKNDKSKINEMMTAIRTRRRIALTGTPLQNHLDEYWCMVEWVKRRYLFAKKEYHKLFVKPIKAGESADAAKSDITKMKKRSHALHQKLAAIVHRRDYTELAKFIKKREFIISVRITDCQKFFYKLFLSKLQEAGKAYLFRSYQSLLRVWNHPMCTVLHSHNQGKAGKSSNSTLQIKMRSIGFVRRELQSTYDYFLCQDAEALARIERVADRREQDLLRDQSQQDRAYRYTEPGATQQPSSAQKSDSNNNSKKRPWNSDDESTASSEDTSDDGNMDDFVVDDDFVEYNSDEDEEDSAEDEEDSDDDSDMPKGKAKKRARKESKTKQNGGRLKKAKTGSENPEQDNARDGEDDDSVEMIDDLDETGIQRKRRVLFESSDEEDAKAEGTSPKDGNGTVATSADKNNETKTPAKPIRSISAPSSAEAGALSANAKAPAPENSLTTSKPPERPITVVDDIAEAALSDEEDVPEALDPLWWRFETPSDLDSSLNTKLTSRTMLHLSNKLLTALSLLAYSVENNEKMIIFSQNIYTLNVFELFMSEPMWGDMLDIPLTQPDLFSCWSKGHHYLRIDGSVSDRQTLIDRFNDPVKGKRCHLMLISTRAGNMGINLQAANRVIIFDCSWNPTSDLQAIYRAFRVGQVRDVFIYRMVASGTMEDKIYKRQVEKMARANRVVDAQNPANAFTDKEKEELMKFEDSQGIEVDEKVFDTINSGTQDVVLSKFLQSPHGTKLFTSIEDHDSFLLEDNEELNEAEKAAAEQELARELDFLRNPEKYIAEQQRIMQERQKLLQEQQQQQLVQTAQNTYRQHVQQQVNPQVSTANQLRYEDEVLIVLRVLFASDSECLTVHRFLNNYFQKQPQFYSLVTPLMCKTRYLTLYERHLSQAFFGTARYLELVATMRAWLAKLGVRSA